MYCNDYKLLQNSLREMADRTAAAHQIVTDKILEAQKDSPIIVYPPNEKQEV